MYANKRLGLGWGRVCNGSMHNIYTFKEVGFSISQKTNAIWRNFYLTGVTMVGEDVVGSSSVSILSYTTPSGKWKHRFSIHSVQ